MKPLDDLREHVTKMEELLNQMKVLNRQLESLHRLTSIGTLEIEIHNIYSSIDKEIQEEENE